MIKIDKLNKVEIEKNTNIIYTKLEKNREKLEKSLEFEEEYNGIINDIFLRGKDIISEDLEIVLNIYEELRIKYPNYLVKMDETKPTYSQKKFNNYISKIFNYNSIFKGKFVYNFVEKLNLEICPYCNRNYVTVVYVNSNKKIRPELDHFFSKSLYPLLSVTINNLIPSCSYCNKKKSKKFFSLKNNLYPYNEGIENIIYFNYEYGESMEEINILFNKKKNVKMDNNAEIFLLDDIYKSHNVIVKDIINKSEIFNKVYREEMNKILGDRSITESEIKYFLGYTNDIPNTSLGKFKNDIIDGVREFKR